MNEKKDILKELKQKGTGFKTPEAYFDQFSVELPETDSSIIPKENGFKVPENYFDQLEERLSEHLNSELPEETGFKVPDAYFKNFDVAPVTKNKNRVIELFKTNRLKIIGLSIAASVLLFFSIYPLANDNTLDFSSLSDNDLETLIDMNSDEFNSLELAKFINVDDEDLYTSEMISEEDISEYLIQTDVENWLPDN